jgi:succinate dehydrogenase/fumarate reductase flavoprotein subunit
MKRKITISKFYCNVLIIGSGAAGLRAAIEACDCDSHVLVLSKSRSKDPHTVLARGGINAAFGTMDPKDNWMIHAADTLREGEFLADCKKVQILCQYEMDAAFAAAVKCRQEIFSGTPIIASTIVQIQRLAFFF